MFVNGFGQSRPTSGPSQVQSAPQPIANGGIPQLHEPRCRCNSANVELHPGFSAGGHPLQSCRYPRPAASNFGDVQPIPSQRPPNQPQLIVAIAEATSGTDTPGSGVLHGASSPLYRYLSPPPFHANDSFQRHPLPYLNPPPRHSAAPDPRAILRAILGANDLDDLLQLLRDHENSLNVRHLDAALNRLGRLAAPAVAATAAAVAAGGGRGRSSSEAAAAASAAVAAARAAGCRLLSVVLLGSATAATAAVVMASLTPRDCASLLSALVRLVSPPLLLPSSSTIKAAVATPAAAAAARLLQTRLLAQLDSAGLRDVAQLLHSSAKLHLELPEGAVPELLVRLDELRLGAAGTPQDVSMVLWSLVNLEPYWRPPSPPRPSPLPPQRPSVPPSSAPPPTNNIWSSPSLTLNTHKAQPPSLEVWLDRLLVQLTAVRLASFQPQSLSNSMWAVARMGYRPPLAWLEGVEVASGRQMEFFSTPELVNLLWGLAVVRHLPLPAWLGLMEGQLRDRAPYMTVQDVSVVCWSLAVLRVRPGLPLLQKLVARALRLRRRMGPQSLVNTLWGLSRMGVRLPERAVALLLQGGMGAATLYGSTSAAAVATPVPAAAVCAATATTARCCPIDLAGAALVLAHCRHVPQRRWLVSYCAAVSRQLHMFRPREITTLLFGIGRLGSLGLRVESYWLDRVLAEVEERMTTTAAVSYLPQQQKSEKPQRTEQQQQPCPQQHQKECLDPAQLAVVLWAVTTLGHRPPGAWVAAMARVVAARAEEFGPREAVTTVRALQELAAMSKGTFATFATAAPCRTTLVVHRVGDVGDRSFSGSSSRGGGGGSSNRTRGHRREGSSSKITGGSSGRSSSTINPDCAEAVARLVVRLAIQLPGRSLYGALRSASLLRSGISYATVADQLLTDVYSVRSLGLLQGVLSTAG